MAARPSLLDNLKDNTRHSAALSFLVQDFSTKHGLSIATGYVNLGGLHHLATIVGDDRETRLLLGAMPEQGLGAGEPLGQFEQQLILLKGERDLSRFPPSRMAKRLKVVDSWLQGDNVEVCRYVKRFLHGKSYLFGDTEDARAALVTSANLTGAGLAANLELGLVEYNEERCRAAAVWFQDLWDQAQPFTEDLRELLFPDPGLIDPDTVYLRALLELYGEEDSAEGLPKPSVELAKFQRDGYERARRIIARHGGVVYADGVGTGKTEIGLALIEQYALREGHYAVVVAPAQLREMWETRIYQARLPAQFLSFQELASDEQLAPRTRKPRRCLANDKDAYRLVLVDEAHSLRNEDTTWYRAMERLLGGEQKDVALLTATPINNGLWDLYNIVMLFARHDRAFAKFGVQSVRDLFINAGVNEKDPENLDPDALFPLVDAVSVRRDRPFIEAHYPDATFPDGTPVRFPKPTLTTERYDLDSQHAGLFDEITQRIDALTMSRYTPTAFLRDNDKESKVEAQLAGLLKSGILKRFESSWYACLLTAQRLVKSHEAFLLAWDSQDQVPSKATLRAAALEETDDAGLATFVADELAGDEEALSSELFIDKYRDAVEADRDRLVEIRDRLEALKGTSDPKLDLLVKLIEDSPADKVAIFSTFGDTIQYLDEQLDANIGGRERVTIIGSETNPDDRMELIARFCPKTVVRPDYQPPKGEVDLLISTDVVSEGQNLQQAQAVISYDMPWNPQKVVQRNGRVMRLKSPHDKVFLNTMLPEPGELEELLRLEARVRVKIHAAGVFGMEGQVIEGIEEELRNYAARIEEGDETLLEEEEGELSGAFIGELLRARVDRATEEGERERVEKLPWGIGAAFIQTAHGSSRGAPGIFFATRTVPMPGAPGGHRYWRFVETGGEVIDSDLEMLRRIDPEGSQDAEVSELDLETAWEIAAGSIVSEHNERVDPRRAQERIGPAQRFALEVLRDPEVALLHGSDRAAEALSVERSSAVRRALNTVRTDLQEEQISRDNAAQLIVETVDEFGLRSVPEEELPREITADDIGVVCWMAVLGSDGP